MPVGCYVDTKLSSFWHVHINVLLIMHSTVSFSWSIFLWSYFLSQHDMLLSSNQHYCVRQHSIIHLYYCVLDSNQILSSGISFCSSYHIVITCYIFYCSYAYPPRKLFLALKSTYWCFSSALSSTMPCSCFSASISLIRTFLFYLVFALLFLVLKSLNILFVTLHLNLVILFLIMCSTFLLMILLLIAQKLYLP